MTDLAVTVRPPVGKGSRAEDEGPPEFSESAGGWESAGAWESGISDEELTELALAADPSAPLPADAVPLDFHAGRTVELLPSWYMGPVRRHTAKRRYRLAVAAVIAALVTIDLFGLCSTYGPLVLA